MNDRVVIIGGGVSGITLGYKLSELGIPCDVIEAEEQIGGLAASFKRGQHHIDLGPHSFYTHDQDVFNFVTDLFKADQRLHEIKRSARLHYNGKFIEYPLTPKSVFQMGVWNGFLSVCSFIKQKLLPDPKYKNVKVETVETWAIKTFGKHLYTSFFKPYTEQFWKKPANEMASSAIPTAKKLTFLSTLMWAFKQKMGGTSVIDRESLPTFYPKTGFGEIPEKLQQLTVLHGGQVHLNARVEAVKRKEDGSYQVSYLQDGVKHTISCGQVVSTIAINRFAQMLSPTPPTDVLDAAAEIEYLGLIVVCLVVKKSKVLGGDLYVYTLKKPYNRATELNEFGEETSPAGENLLLYEITASTKSAAWNAPDAEHYEACMQSVVADGFLKRSDVIGYHVIKAPYAYPVFKKDFATHVGRVRKFLKDFDERIHVLGRTGEFLYMDSDMCMAKAFKLAEKIAKLNNVAVPEAKDHAEKATPAYNALTQSLTTDLT